MLVSEFINECHECFANIQYVNSSWRYRILPESSENLYPGNMVYLQGVPTTTSPEEVVRTVLSWTDGDDRAVSVRELCNIYCGASYEDRELPIDWL